MSDLFLNKTFLNEGDFTYKEIDEILNKKRFDFILKRIFDILFSLFGLIILSPVFFIILIVIKMDSRGPVFFKQIRIGKNGKEYKILKFRTMIVDAEKKGMQITVGNDSRITRSGQLLRKFKLDELPQLINVLFGEMSFVGPRPEVPKYVSLYDCKQKIILKVKPGITDPASIEYRDESTLLAQSVDPEKRYVEEIMPRKILLNVMYLRNISFIFDISLIFKTIFLVIKR